MHESSSSAGPVAPAERLLTLDVLRAFALLGILVMNMPGFFGSMWDARPFEVRWPARPDRVATWVMDTFFSGKFNSLFAFLFGVGFSIQLDRLMARSSRPVLTYLRRLAVLLAFGVAHALLLWIGDVLHVYAILGVVLVLMRRVSDRVVLGAIVAGLVFPVLFGVFMFFTYTPTDAQTDQALFGSIDPLVVAAHTSGSYADVVRTNLLQMRTMYSDPRGYLFFPSLFLTILLGYLFGRRGYLQDPGAHLAFWQQLRRWAFGIGIVTALTFSAIVPFLEPFTPSVLGLVAGAAYTVQRPALMLFYASAIVLLVHGGRLPRLATWLAPMGRMPLTNYLLQSVTCTLIFNAYGLGLFNRIGPAIGFVMALGLWTLQVLASQLWMRRFAFGPMEWLWRLLTYGTAPSAHSAPARVVDNAPVAGV